MPAVHFSEPWRGWCITRYADVAAGFRDARLSAKRSATWTAMLPPEVRDRLAPLTRNMASWALIQDPPDHTRLRGLVAKSFTPRVVERLRPAIGELTRMLLDEAPGDTVDVVRDLAAPLPVIVIGDLLGLPRDDRHLLKEWSDTLAAFLGAARPSLERAETATRSVVAMEDYFRDAIAERRRKPTDDLLGMLATTEELTDQELLSTCAMLLFGGHETTTNLIANGLHALLAHPAELARLRSAPEAMPGAVEELLRFESPVQRMGRVASEELVVAGVRIPAGERVFLVIGAANRDPAAFVEPDRLDVMRSDVRHLSLGLGAHYCIGASLGRMEAQIALGELLSRYRTIEPAYEEPTWHDNATIRGLAALPVACRAS